MIRSFDGRCPTTSTTSRIACIIWDWIEAQFHEEPHWLLDALGVDPSRRSRGIGSALVRWGLERAASDGVPATLETGRPENVGYYERLGFRVVLEGEPAPGGPHVWFMRLDP